MRKIILAAFIAVLLLPMAAQAQKNVTFKTPEQIKQDIDNANARIKAGLDKTSAGVKSAVTGTPDKTAALPCMDLSVLTKLTPFNLVSTIKGCEQDGIKQLISDSSRALASAQAYVGPNGGAPGDGDGIACHKPALALWQVALDVPANPGSPAIPASPAIDAVPAVMNPDGSIKTPAVAAVPAVQAQAAVPATPALEAGPILLAQKFGEFVKSGGITSCIAWINNQINAVNAAAAEAAGGAVAAVAGAALIVPKP